MKDKSKQDSGHGYWMYKDGSSYWGISLLREFECPLKATEEIVKATTIPEKATPEERDNILRDDMYRKLNWYKETSEKIEADRKAKEEADKN